MAKKIYLGINNRAKNINNLYIGIDNIAKRVSAIYIGNAFGKARQCYPYVEDDYGPYEIYLNGVNVTIQIAKDSKKWVEIVTDRKRPVWTDQNNYYFSITVPVGYTARVYRQYKDDKVELTGADDINEGFPLGTDVDYTIVNGSIVPAEGSPSKFIAKYTFHDTVEYPDIKIIVELFPKITEFYFDATNFVTIPNGAGRGSIGTDVGWTGSGNADGNLVTLDGWNWTTNKSQVTKMPMTKNENGKYDYEFTFQTNNGSPIYVLDKLEFNGHTIAIPFVPETTSKEEDAAAAIGKPGTQETTILSDGTEITVRLVRVFSSPQQRVYTIYIKNAMSNMIVSDGNICYLTSTTEYYFGPLIGVSSFQQLTSDGWVDRRMNYPSDYIDDNNYFRFKLMDGYANPTYKYTKIDTVETIVEGSNGPVIPLENIEDCSENNIYGPDSEGWYYIKLLQKPYNNVSGGYNIMKLSIIARLLNT